MASVWLAQRARGVAASTLVPRHLKRVVLLAASWGGVWQGGAPPKAPGALAKGSVVVPGAAAKPRMPAPKAPGVAAVTFAAEENMDLYVLLRVAYERSGRKSMELFIPATRPGVSDGAGVLWSGIILGLQRAQEIMYLWKASDLAQAQALPGPRYWRARYLVFSLAYRQVWCAESAWLQDEDLMR